MSKKHMGSSIDDFLKKEGTFEGAQTQAIKEVVAWQLSEAMTRQKVSKNRLAALLKTSRTQVDRLLDTKSDITLSSLQRAAAVIGRRVSITLIPGDINGNGVIRTNAEGAGRGRQLVERLRGRGSVGRSTDEILTLTRGGSRKKRR
jgi:antitoxin HicB